MDTSKIMAIADLFRKGSAVANKEAWKSGQVTGTVLVGAVLAGVQVAKMLGADISIDTETVNSVCAAVVCVVNVVLTWTTSESAGILPAKE